MKEMLTLILIITSVFSLFLYYKLNPEVANKIANHNYEENDVSAVITINEDNNILKESFDEEIDVDNCTLNETSTNYLSFQEAFKYYRNCLGDDNVFKWNNNYYLTKLANEMNTNNLLVNKDNESINNKEADKLHLQLQNDIIGTHLNE